MSATPKQMVQVYGRKKTATAVAHCRAGQGLIKVNGKPLEQIEPKALQFKLQEPTLVIGKGTFYLFFARLFVNNFLEIFWPFFRATLFLEIFRSLFSRDFFWKYFGAYFRATFFGNISVLILTQISRKNWNKKSREKKVFARFFCSLKLAFFARFFVKISIKFVF